jgi:dihydroorotase
MAPFSFLLRGLAAVALLWVSISSASAQEQYDLLLQGGHVVDAKNHLSGERDITIRDGKIAAVAEHIAPSSALKTVNLSGLYVTPGLVDYGIWPDGFTFRNGVTTIADAGSSGWRNFEDFKEHIIDRAKTRVLAFLNIVGAGMRGPKYEGNLADMQPEPAAEMAKRHPGLIVGIKTAHYSGPEWTAVENAVKAGTLANIPVMVDFGANRPERPIDIMLTQKMRPGDIYTTVTRDCATSCCPMAKSIQGHVGGQKTRRHFRCGTRRWKFCLAHCRARYSAGLLARLDFDGFAYQQHEYRYERHA